MLGVTPEGFRALRRGLLQTGFGLLVFSVALYFCFPYDRAKDLAIAWAAAQGFDVTIGSAGPGLGFAVNFKDIHVRTRQTGAGKPVRFTLDSAVVRVSPFAMLVSKKTAMGVDAAAFGGKIDVDIDSQKKGPFRYTIRSRSVDLAEIPGVRESINLPLTGKLEVTMDLASATGHYNDADGALSFKCSGCVLGDGKTPLKIEGNPLLAGGLTLPKVRLGDLVGRVAVVKGNAKLEGVEAKSPDGDLALEGDIQLHDPLALSTMTLYLRFRLSDTLLKSADKLQMMLQMAGSAGKRPDGFYGVRLTGRFGSMNPPVFSTVSPSGNAGTVPGIRAGLRGTSASGSFGRPSIASPVPQPTPPPTLNATIESPSPPSPPSPSMPPPPMPSPPPVIASPPDTPPPPPPAAPPSPPEGTPPSMRGAPPGAPSEDDQGGTPPPVPPPAPTPPAQPMPGPEGEPS
ncbi:MAG TPA: type II secretion system protein GspN [Polyangia bacterium]|jgi:type II secretion system protein N|nr:type II secretion system protein GspN [Polyangia bacterium]